MLYEYKFCINTAGILIFLIYITSVSNILYGRSVCIDMCVCLYIKGSFNSTKYHAALKYSFGVCRDNKCLAALSLTFTLKRFITVSTVHHYMRICSRSALRHISWPHVTNVSLLSCLEHNVKLSFVSKTFL